MRSGFIREASSQLEQAMRIDDGTPGTHANPLAGADPAIFVRAYLSRTKAIMGQLEQADALAAQGFALAIERGHVPTILMA